MQDWVFRLGVVTAAHLEGKYLFKAFSYAMQSRASTRGEITTSGSEVTVWTVNVFNTK